MKAKNLTQSLAHIKNSVNVIVQKNVEVGGESVETLKV